jgi:N6-adenosine-specific RNA methylase IME4
MVFTMTEQLTRTFLADPPWMDRGGGNSKRGADGPYELMSKEQILTTMRGWMWGDLINRKSRVDQEGAHLWTWSTSNFLPDALWLIDRLGFRYLTSAVWVKMKTTMLEPNEDELDHVAAVYNSRLQIGLGQYMRHAHEWLLLSTLGEAMVPPPDRRPPSVIFATRTKHSQKPEESYKMIEQVSPWPRLEMFARRPRDGWSVVGNEIQKEQ